MTTFVLLLRGVTPSGKNKVSMARLREALREAGFLRVRTYIQSGNVLVDTGLPRQAVEEEVHDLVRDKLGPDLTVIARTGPELEEALENNPFTAGYDISRVFFISYAETPPADKVRDLLARDFGQEKLASVRQTAYLYIPGPYGKGTLSNNFLEKQLGIRATMRNFNTMSRLLAMSREG